MILYFHKYETYTLLKQINLERITVRYERINIIMLN
jgi:hypothetical protein